VVLLGIGFAINLMRPPTIITVAQGDVPTVVTPNSTVSSLLTNLTAMQCLDNVSFEWKPCVNIQTDGENLAFLPVAVRIPANYPALLVFKNNSSA
jgi:hypothetical protein